MRTDVVMPQMGESIAEGTIARWLKQVGDTVERDEPLLEISTDKVDAEIPSPVSGILVAIRAAQGTTAEVLSVLGVIDDAPGAVVDAAPTGAPMAAASPAAASSTKSGQAPAAQGAGAASPGASAGSSAAPRSAGTVAHLAAAVPSGLRVSPVARRVAGYHGVDLATVAATGEAGRVTKRDVLARLAGAAPAAAPVMDAVARGAGQAVELGAAAVEVVPATPMRRSIAAHMTASRATSAHAYSLMQMDCTGVEAARRARKAEFETAGAKLSVLPFILQAAALALRDFPVLNASLTADGVVYHGDINVGVAVALDGGLIVPVIRRADGLSLLQISVAIADLARRARAKRLKPEEVASGTFTVTNPGNFGGTFATPIINQPQVAILEVGTVESRVVVANDALAIRSMVNLTLGFDHRLIDGAVADQYLAAVRRALEGVQLHENR